MKRPWTVWRWSAGCLVALQATAAAWAAEPAAAPNWVRTDNGASVIDQRTQLVWSRCVEGTRWTGQTCAGEPSRVTHAEAIALAAARTKAEGLQWRLPRVNELRRLVDQAVQPPGLDPRPFPAAPDDWHWAITANVNTAPVNQYDYGNIAQGRTSANANSMAFRHGWAVNMVTGEARGDVAKRTKLPVRLVRSPS